MLLVPQPAAAASNAIWVHFGFVFFLFCLTKDVLFVLVGSEPVVLFLVATCVVLVCCFVIVFGLACRFSSGGARLLCVPYSSCLRLGVFCLPLFGLPLLFVIFFGVCIPLSTYLFVLSFCFPFFSCFSWLAFRFSRFQYIWVAGMRMLCLLYAVRRHGLALSTSFTALRCRIHLCRSFVPIERASLLG